MNLPDKLKHMADNLWEQRDLFIEFVAGNFDSTPPECQDIIDALANTAEKYEFIRGNILHGKEGYCYVCGEKKVRSLHGTEYCPNHTFSEKIYWWGLVVE